jgi:ribosomal protein L11 methyltransferase
MKSRHVWRVSVITNSEAEDAVVEILRAFCEQPASCYTDLESGTSESCVYFDQAPEAWTLMRRQLLDRVEGLETCGLETSSVRVSLRKLTSNSWLQSWKKHFKPLEIDTALLVKPGWSKRRRKPGQAIVILDPGLSFGTGQHPTTEFCLRSLVSVRNELKNPSFLDVGTGSGILAIAAAKLGFAPVDAFDFDPDSIAVASANAVRNRVVPRIRIWRQDIATLSKRSPRQYTVICANLLADLLMIHRDRLTARVKPGGSLVLAGILKEEFDKVSEWYLASGFECVSHGVGGEWCSGQFRRPASRSMGRKLC